MPCGAGLEGFGGECDGAPAWDGVDDDAGVAVPGKAEGVTCVAPGTAAGGAATWDCEGVAVPGEVAGDSPCGDGCCWPASGCGGGGSYGGPWGTKPCAGAFGTVWSVSIVIGVVV